MIPRYAADRYKVLVACECSGIVRDAFIAEGISAISCDLKPTRAPGPHYQGDLFDLPLEKFELVIAHPPCTAICLTASWKYKNTVEREEAAAFFMRIWNSPARRLCIENAKGIMPKLYPARLPKAQYIQPHQFGHPTTKLTGLWLRNLPPLVPTRHVKISVRAEINNVSGYGEERREKRSNTYRGIAKAMARQWGALL